MLTEELELKKHNQKENEDIFTIHYCKTVWNDTETKGSKEI